MSPGGSRSSGRSRRGHSAWPSPCSLGVLVAACSSGADVTQRASNSARATTVAARRPTGIDDRPRAAGSGVDTSGSRSVPAEPTHRVARSSTSGVDVGTLDVPIDYDDPDGRRSSCTRPPPRRRARRADRHAARQPRRARLRRQRLRASSPSSDLRRGAARPLRHRRLGPAGHRARASRRSTASTTTTTSSPAPTSRPTTTPERQQLIDLAEEFADDCVDQERRHPPVRRHQQLGPRHGRDPPGARRGRDQLLRVQLRQRARRDVGDAVPRHRAGRRARRRRRPNADTHRVRAPADCEASRTRSTTFLAQCSADPTCAFHNDGDAEGAFDELMARARRQADPERRRAAPTSPAAWRCTPSPRRCTATPSGRQLAEALADAQHGDGAGLLALYDAYYQRNPTARGQRARGVPGDHVHGHDRAARRSPRSDATVAEFTAAAPRLAPAGTTGELLLHVLPAVDRPAGRRSPAPAPARSSSSAPPATRRRRSTARGRWPPRSRTAGSSWSPPTSTPATASTPASTTSSTTTSSTSSRPTTAPSAAEQTHAPFVSARRCWRKEWDSNPRRPKGPQRLSRPSHSSTLASFRRARLAARASGPSGGLCEQPDLWPWDIDHTVSSDRFGTPISCEPGRSARADCKEGA